jgi:hypothetical protein
MICQTIDGYHYSIIKDGVDEWMGFSDKKIPSNWRLDVKDILVVKKIMQEVRVVFYKIQ